MLGGFAIVITIALVLGVWGYYGAVTSCDAIHLLRVDSMPTVHSLLVLNETQAKIDGIESAFLCQKLTSDLKRELFKEAAEAKQEADEAWKIYEPIPRTADEEANWRQFVPAWKQMVGRP